MSDSHAAALPVEILQLIIEKLATSGPGDVLSKQSLRSCCLVSRDFAHMARKHLFSTIDLIQTTP